MFLTEEELNTLATKDVRNERLSQVRDIFVFSCYTGLAYVDVQQLTKDNISIGIDGEKWIYTFRQKTDTRTHIPWLLKFPYNTFYSPKIRYIKIVIKMG